MRQPATLPENAEQVMVRLTMPGELRNRVTRVEIEGENLRPVTWVLVEEVRSGDWGIAGNGLTTADVHALQGQSEVKSLQAHQRLLYGNGKVAESNA